MIIVSSSGKPTAPNRGLPLLGPLQVPLARHPLAAAAPTADQAKKVIFYWAETLHEYGSESWAPRMIKAVEAGDQFESFRELWQTIQAEVVGEVVRKT